MKLKDRILNAYYKYHNSKKRPHKVYFGPLVLCYSEIVFVPLNRSIKIAFELRDVKWAGGDAALMRIQNETVTVRYKDAEIALQRVEVSFPPTDEHTDRVLLTGIPKELIDRVVISQLPLIPQNHPLQEPSRYFYPVNRFTKENNE